MTSPTTFDADISPEGTLESLSKTEIAKLLDKDQGGLHELFRNCALAVLNCGNEVDDTHAVLEAHRSFEIDVVQRERGIKLTLKNAPAAAFVDGKLIKGIQDHLFAVLRDILFLSAELDHSSKFDLSTSAGTTDAVFHILRNAGVLHTRKDPNLVVCWGGHSIGPVEYDYTKEVGYELGLRGMDICTGCGPGAMKGPMKGATISHAKQRIAGGRYFGFSEPGINAAEAPNPIVNSLVVLPDIEKRLEAFVRTGHGIVVFPGGVGTAEEILYILGILMHPDNAGVPYPLVFTGPVESADYFTQIDNFVRATLGEAATKHYEIVIGDAARVAKIMRDGIQQVRAYRKEIGDAYYFNWALKIDRDFQVPFEPTHENMAKLVLHTHQPAHMLAAQLRRAFSGIVAGNVKVQGIAAIQQRGPFMLAGDRGIMRRMDAMLESFVAQNRMKMPGTKYKPCYILLK